MIAVFQTLPMRSEGFEALCIDILQSAVPRKQYAFKTHIRFSRGRGNVHTSSTPGNFPPLLQTLDFSSPVGVGLALHVIVIVRSTSCADEE